MTMELEDKKEKRHEKWEMCGCLLPPSTRDDLKKMVKANKEKYPDKGDPHCSVSGLIRLWINEKLYPMPAKKEEKEGVLKLA